MLHAMTERCLTYFPCPYGFILFYLPLSLVSQSQILFLEKLLRSGLSIFGKNYQLLHTQEQRSNLGWKSSSKAAKPSNLLQTSDCLGAEMLIKLLKNYSRSHDVSLPSNDHIFNSQ